LELGVQGDIDAINFNYALRHFDTFTYRNGGSRVLCRPWRSRL